MKVNFARTLFLITFLFWCPMIVFSETNLKGMVYSKRNGSVAALTGIAVDLKPFDKQTESKEGSYGFNKLDSQKKVTISFTSKIYDDDSIEMALIEGENTAPDKVLNYNGKKVKGLLLDLCRAKNVAGFESVIAELSILEPQLNGETMEKLKEVMKLMKKGEFEDAEIILNDAAL